MLDITIAPVKDLWGFSDLPTAQVPAQEDLVSLLPHVDYRCVEINENRVRLRDSEAALDLGFIAKGYIADRLGELLIAEGAVSAVVNLGGNVLTVGSKHGEPFRVGIQKPFADSGVPITRVDCTDSSVVTSGIYERFFTQDETLFHHILDPSTGYPAQTDLLSATVLSKDSATGDALSTACLMLGLDKAKALIDSIDHVEAIFVTTENKIVYTY
ncbi:MAG: FAD:protein FMN transferase [Lachnospiraceae bacterium]|nr:FAD:protein FMN transferase [Lachnospiraceae bacterium]